MLFNKKVFFTGTQISYYFICPTKLWLFSHFITMEQESDVVALGKSIHKTTYSSQKKELIIDQRIGIDFIQKKEKIIVHEIKKSDKLEKAHIMQLLYYLFYLKYEKGVNKIEGIINYPLKRKITKVKLNEENEKKLRETISKIKHVLSLKNPPTPKHKPYCKKCSYYEFCFSK